ncbi:hypothetical protein UFOVP402_24 [uncultured Caudovirales phage]|uniref:Uncharacterized protein n=1 Tax=uncultured Caudovirales phage TaxID=2100421 RepID=A0A6J5M5F9_9CAUD|nr:hypothetical protein UFOVP402_24 [uncultured Caudovirales phage]
MGAFKKMKSWQFMRKLLLILFLTPVLAKSQTINGRLYTQFNNYYKWRGGAFDSTLLLPNVTATAGIRPGAIRYNGADSSVYVWTGSQWRVIAGSGGGSSYTFTNGLTESGGVVRLGGELTQPTDVYGNNIFLDAGVGGAGGGSLSLVRGTNKTFSLALYDDNSLTLAQVNADSINGLRLIGTNDQTQIQIKDSIWFRDYNVTTATLTGRNLVTMSTTGALSRYTGSVLTAEVDNLDSVVRRGATTANRVNLNGGVSTTDSVNVIASNGEPIVSLYKQNFGNDGGFVSVKDEGGINKTFVTSSSVQFFDGTNTSVIQNGSLTANRNLSTPDTSGTLGVGASINGGTPVMAGSNGIIPLTISGGGADSTTFATQFRLDSTRNGIRADLNGKQNTLVSGTTIKTVNGESLLGSGNISISGGGVAWTGVDSTFAASQASNGEHHIEEFRGNATGTGSNSGITGGNYFFIASSGNLIGFYEGGRSAVRIGTLTSASATPHIHNGWASGTISAAYQMNSNWTVFTTSIRIPTLNDGTDRYHIRVGMVGGLNVSPLGTGLVFTYDLSGTQTGSTATGNWQTVTASSNVRTYNQNAVNNTAVTANTWTKLQIVFNDVLVYFYVNGTLIGTHTNNLPTGTNFVPYFDIRKTNGTTARSLEIDYSAIDIKYSSPR